VTNSPFGNPEIRTDQDGRFELFTDIPGYYQLRFEEPFGYVFTKKNVNEFDFNVDSDAHPISGIQPKGYTEPFQMPAGQTIIQYSAGLIRASQVEPIATEAPASAEDAYNQGIERFNDGDVDGALDAFAYTLELDSDFVRAHYNIGVISLQNGDIGTALEHFESTVLKDPDYALGHYGLAIVKDALGLTQDALLEWQQFLDLYSSDDERRAYAEQRVAALTSSSGGGGVQAGQVSGSYAHTQPGEQSEIYLNVQGAEGQSVSATASGPGLLDTASQSATIGADGNLRLAWVIDQLGSYTISGTIDGQSFSVTIKVE
jgi:tetratricopeptide (TPR) repeat protein